MKDRLRSLSRRDLLKVLGAVGLGAFGGVGWLVHSDADNERKEGRLSVQKELESYRFEVRVPRVGSVSGFVSLAPPIVEPSRLIVEVDVFLVKGEPTTKVDEAGINHMFLTGGVLRYDPYVIKNPSFPYEKLPSYEIINPQNVGVIARFPQ